MYSHQLQIQVICQPVGDHFSISTHFYKKEKNTWNDMLVYNLEENGA